MAFGAGAAAFAAFFAIFIAMMSHASFSCETTEVSKRKCERDYLEPNW